MQKAIPAVADGFLCDEYEGSSEKAIFFVRRYAMEDLGI